MLCMQLLRPVRERWGYRILVGIALALLCIFYAVLWLYHQQHGCAPASYLLRPLRPAQGDESPCAGPADRAAQSRGDVGRRRRSKGRPRTRWDAVMEALGLGKQKLY